MVRWQKLPPGAVVVGDDEPLPQGYRKYHNQPVVIAGQRFDSKAEGRRYQQLILLQAQGTIQALTIHPAYELQPAFEDHFGENYLAITYEADFSYWQGDRVIVEDVKGHKTRVFALKAKMFHYRYPGIELRIIDANTV